jgi:chromosome partitioning protein
MAICAISGLAIRPCDKGERRPVKTILIASQKGGAGKSTLAAHFGVLAESLDGPALLIDADPQGSLAVWYSGRQAEAPLLAKADAGSIAATLDDAERSGIAWTIIDSPPHNAPLVASLMSRATLTIVPVRPGPFDLAAAGATLDMARTLRAPMVAVISHAPPPTRETEPSLVAEARAVLESMGAPVLPGQVSQRAALSHALISGQAVSEFEPGGRAAGEIEAAWKAITRIIDELSPRSI